MVVLVSVAIALLLLNLVGLIILFRAIVVTNVKIEEEQVYKKEIRESLDGLDEASSTIKSQQTIIIDTLKRVVDLL